MQAAGRVDIKQQEPMQPVSAEEGRLCQWTKQDIQRIGKKLPFELKSLLVGNVKIAGCSAESQGSRSIRIKGH